MGMGFQGGCHIGDVFLILRRKDLQKEIVLSTGLGLIWGTQLVSIAGICDVVLEICVQQVGYGPLEFRQMIIDSYLEFRGRHFYGKIIIVYKWFWCLRPPKGEKDACCHCNGCKNGSSGLEAAAFGSGFLGKDLGSGFLSTVFR